MMAPGDHKHLSMTDATQCKSCGYKMVKAQREYNRLIHEYPDKFVRKQPEEPFSPYTENLGQMLEDRIKNDTLYQNHLKKLAFGTPEEKQKEMRRMKNGFYEKHTGDAKRILFL